MTHPILDVRGASGGYGDFQALFSVDFEIAPGEVVALIGANGAGKSTLLNTVAGLLPVREVPPRVLRRLNSYACAHGRSGREEHAICGVTLDQLRPGLRVGTGATISKNNAKKNGPISLRAQTSPQLRQSVTSAWPTCWKQMQSRKS